MDVKLFKQLPIMGILRGVEPQQLPALLDNALAAGLKTLEITMNTARAAELIQQSQRYAAGRLMIGAGTVLNREMLQQALKAGASFIVLPALVAEVVRDCVKQNIPVFPGALTPQEIIQAWQAGATMVKVFPIKFFGPDYIQEIKGPFPEIELLACSGITPANLPAYFRCGASAVALGSSVFKREWLVQGDYQRIKNLLMEYINAYHSVS